MEFLKSYLLYIFWSSAWYSDTLVYTLPLLQHPHLAPLFLLLLPHFSCRTDTSWLLISTPKSSWGISCGVTRTWPRGYPPTGTIQSKSFLSFFPSVLSQPIFEKMFVQLYICCHTVTFHISIVFRNISIYSLCTVSYIHVTIILLTACTVITPHLSFILISNLS